MVQDRHDLEHLSLSSPIVYTPGTVRSLNARFKEYASCGIICSRFEDNTWTCYSGVQHQFLFFEIPHISEHTRDLLGLSETELVLRLKYFALAIFNTLVFQSINKKINSIKEFLGGYGELCVRVPQTDVQHIQMFLRFLNVSEMQACEACRQIYGLSHQTSTPRQLAHLVNYLCIHNELTDMYSTELEKEMFVRWFPILFWVMVTFVLPMRATETLLTPFDCLRQENDGYVLQVRRTRLKHSGLVFHNVEQDYRVFDYRIPNINIVNYIKKYQEYTGAHKRRYLFDYTWSSNHMLGLGTFNRLLAEFWKEHLKGNPRYSFVRSYIGEENFVPINAGDSRHIAMSNLFFQGISAETCRELADHNSLDTSYGYYTNVASTIEASAILHHQRELNRRSQEIDTNYSLGISDNHRQTPVQPAPASPVIPGTTVSLSLDAPDASVEPISQQLPQIPGMEPWKTGAYCMAENSPYKTNSLEECIRQNHLYECFGCCHYVPDIQEIERIKAQRKAEMDRNMRDVMKAFLDTPEQLAEMDDLLLNIHSSTVRYYQACEIAVEKGSCPKFGASFFHRLFPLRQAPAQVAWLAPMFGVATHLGHHRKKRLSGGKDTTHRMPTSQRALLSRCQNYHRHRCLTKRRRIMGRKQKYSADLLLRAVEQYAAIYHGEIVLTALAEWANANIPELRGVKYYHFTRASRSENGETQPMSKVRIDEINTVRGMIKATEKNLLLQKTDQEFFSRNLVEQKAILADARRYAHSLNSENSRLSKQVVQLTHENEILRSQVQTLHKQVTEVGAAAEDVRIKLNRITKLLNEKQKKAALASFGISDDMLNLLSISVAMDLERPEDAFSIDDAIEKFETGTPRHSSILDDIDFEGDDE